MILEFINPAVIATLEKTRAAHEKAHQAFIQELMRESQAQPTLQDEALVTANELAERLSVPVSWVYEQSRLGKLPTHKIGRYSRFKPSEVLAQCAAKPLN